MPRRHMRKDDEDRFGVLFIPGPIPDHSHVIRNMLVKARGEGHVGVVECFDGCDDGCEKRIEGVMERHRIDLIVAPYAAYERIERMRLAHLFVDLEAVLFGGEATPEIFSARPGQFGLAGTRIDAGLPTSAIDAVQNPLGRPWGAGGATGRTAAMGIMLGMGGARLHCQDLLGAGGGPPTFHPGANVASGGAAGYTDTVRIGGTEYQVSRTTNEYGGRDYYQGESTVIKTDSNGTVRETTEVSTSQEGSVTTTEITTTKYDKQGRKTETGAAYYRQNQSKPNPDKKESLPGGREPDESGEDVRTAMKEFIEKMMLKQLWEAMLSGKLPPERSDVTREFVGWLQQQNVTDFCHLFEAEFKERDETGYAWAYWVSQTVGSRYVRASKLWEYLWSKGAPIDPIGSVAYPGRVGTVGGGVDPNSGELGLHLHGKHDVQ